MAVGGAVVFAPALWSPFLLDDYIHQSMVSGTFPGSRGPFDLYNFVDDDNRAALLERGLIPWWAAARLTLHFFRPLSSALLWADHRLFDDPLIPHFESYAWWLALALIAGTLFRRHLSRRAALIAAGIFALAPCHALPLAWLANREVLLSLLFSTLALIQLDAWREDRGALRPWAAAALFAIAMSAGEYGLACGAYVLTAAVLQKGRTPGQRLVTVLTFALPALGYLALRAHANSGARGTGFYVDPLHEPVRFLTVAPRRLAMLLCETWFSLDTETLTAATPLLAVMGLSAILVALVIVVRKVLARRSEDEQAFAVQMLPGSLIAMLPLLAVAPSPRLGGAAMLGIAPCLALFLDEMWFGAPTLESVRRWYERAAPSAAVLLGFAHLVHGPATSWLIGRAFSRSASLFAEHAADLHARMPDAEHTEVIVMRGLGGAFFLPFGLDPRGAGPPRWTILSQTGHLLSLRRDARTLELSVPAGQGLFPRGHDNLFRAENDTFAAGQVITIPGVKITVLDVDEGGPRSARYEFDRDLESPAMTWIEEKVQTGFALAPPPAIGFGQPFEP